MSEHLERFDVLLKGANDFCESAGLRKNIILDIYKADSDWTFIIQVDALLETAAKSIISNALKLEVRDRFVGQEDLIKFVRSLPMNGRSSLSNLLRASGCDKDLYEFVQATRAIRNAFAHNIHNVDSSLLDVLEKHQEGSKLLKQVSFIENCDEDEWKDMIRSNGELLRFAFLNNTMVFLLLGYSLSTPEKSKS